uniref:Uncharacterized protein n=1 Tax=Arundo donax TaxID=35708 RepID=A0A0A8ZDN2_ARUDO
MRWGAAASG